jgi:hypothetical protein
MYRTRDDTTDGVRVTQLPLILPRSIGNFYQEFRKAFMISSPDIKHVCGLKEAISNNYSGNEVKYTTNKVHEWRFII